MRSRARLLLALTLFFSAGCDAFLESLLEELDGIEGNDENLPAAGWTGRYSFGEDLAWRSNRDLSDARFAELFQVYSDQGLMIIDVDARSEGNETTFSMVWQENVDGRAWAEHRNLTSDEYHELWTQYGEQGLRPLDVEGYMIDGQLRFAGIWIDNVEGLQWSSVREMTSQEYSEYFDTKSAEGFFPIDIEAYDTPAGRRFAAIWYENVNDVTWSQLRNIDRARYQQEADAHAAAGLLLVDFESYDAGDEQRYAAIWTSIEDRPASQVRTDRDQRGYANLWREYGDAGYRIVDYENYNFEGDIDARYGGIWIENADRFRHPKRAALDQELEAYELANTFPGMAVAIVQDGDVIYRRGFGHADIANDKVAHTGTVYGYASVSKVIGGTLLAKMEAEEVLRDGTTFEFDMSRSTAAFLDDLPAHHTHTVEQIAAHLGCIAHYTTTPSITDQSTHFGTQLAAVASIWDTQLVTGCTIGGTRSYSTPAFTFMGAALEVATGRSTAQLLHEEIFAPYGLSSMRVTWSEDTLPPDYERAVLYADNVNDEVEAYKDSSWKIMGGGIEGDVLDLATFGWLVLDGQIVDVDTRDNRMWAPVDPSCAAPGPGTCRNGIAWELRTRDGRRVAEHGGSWLGVRSRLRVYRDDGLVIATTSNRRSHDTDALIDDLADIVLAP